MSLINCLNCNLKLCIKYKFIDHIINNIWLIQNLTCVLSAKNMNLTVRFLKYIEVFILLYKVMALNYN